MTWQSFAVEQVLSAAPDAVIGVNMGGDQGFRTFTLAGDLGNVDPQEGDNVIIDVDSMPGGADPVVVRYPVPDRVHTPDSVTLTVSNSAPPSGLGFEMASAVYASTASNALWLVRDIPITAPTNGKTTIPATSARTWDPVNGWDGANADGKVRQGSFGSGGCKGLWFYGSTVAAAVSGHTGVTMKLTVNRDSRGGTPWSPKPLTVWAHNYAGQPTGEPALMQMSNPPAAMVGVSSSDPSQLAMTRVTFDLPAPIVAMLVAGTAQGVGIGSDSEDDYLVCLGPTQDPWSGLITPSWTS